MSKEIIFTHPREHATREDFLKALHAAIGKAHDAYGINPKTQQGRRMAAAICATIYDVVSGDPALWLACLRNDHEELINWMDNYEKIR